MTVVNVGLDLLAEAVASQAAVVTRVDWRPPLPDTEDDLAAVALDPVRAEANKQALEQMLAVLARLVDVVPAREALGLEAGRAPARGPADRLGRARPGLLRGALMGGCGAGGESGRRPRRRRRRSSHDGSDREPRAVPPPPRPSWPMAGVVSPSMWVFSNT